GAYKFTVDMKTLSCSCKVWDLNGIPCPHVVCTIQPDGKDAVDFISHWYKKDTYLKAYQYSMKPVKSAKYWPQTGLEAVEPPHARKMLGSPKFTQTRDPDEPKKVGKLSKKHFVMNCRLCVLEPGNAAEEKCFWQLGFRVYNFKNLFPA
ncbi:SWIM domain-containing protein, partial [Cephalotus follicularis]